MAVEYCTAQQVSEFMGLPLERKDDAMALVGDAAAAQKEVHISLANLRKLSIGDKLWMLADDVGNYEEVTIAAFGADHFETAVDLVGTYHIADNSATWLQSYFHNESHPHTRTYVESLIEDTQVKIDKLTHHSFYGDGQSYGRWFPFMPHFRRRYPLYYPMPFEPLDTYWVVWGLHRDIRTLDATKGDELLVYQGSDIIDFIATKIEWRLAAGAGSRTGDFWLDYEKGRLYFVGSRPMYTPKAIFWKYRYGGSEGVPGDIKQACLMMACIQLLQSERYAVDQPGGDEAGTPKPKDTIAIWQDEVDRIIQRNREILMYDGGA